MTRSPTHKSDVAASGADMVTMDMVARLAGVSISTVSRILNGTAVVAESKRLLVQQAIDKLGFVPNPVARGLAGGRTLSIGVITQFIDSPFYGAALRGIETALQRAGYSALFVSGHWNAREEQRCIAALRSRRVDGLIVLDGRLSNPALKQVAREFPVVVTGRALQAPNVCALQFDNALGAKLATDYLLELGHREIVFIAGDPGHQDGQERLRGCTEALAAHGLQPVGVVNGDFTEAGGMRAIDQVLATGRRFSAVFAANDQMAMGAALRLSQAGLHIPQQVSLVGFDDLQASMFTIPPLTTVHQPSEEIGHLTVQALMQLLQGEQPQLRMPLPRLVVRDSTARCATGKRASKG